MKQTKKRARRYLRAWMLLMCMVFAVSSRARTYRNLPSLPGPVTLDDWRFSIIRPVGRTNLILNPSVETNTTGYTAVGGSIARSTTFAYHGAYSLAITPTAATTDGAYYTTSSLTSGTVYAVSVKVLGTPGRPYRLAVASNAGVVLQTQAFTATGQWQWITMLHAATVTATHRIYVAKNGGTQTNIFYMDGLQLEVCAANEYYPTTYIDGDQLGLLGAVELPPYYWTGTPHASTSVRSGQTRAGGRVVPLSYYRFTPTNIQGLGMAPVQQITTPFAQLDGSQFLDTRKTDRGVTITGRWQTATPYDRQRRMAALMADLDRDLIATRQPLTILAEPLVRGKPTRAPLMIPALSYVEGLSGDLDSLPTGESIISFTQYQPRINGGDTGAALTVIATPVASGIHQRNPDGSWTAPRNASDGGYFPGVVRALAFGIDGSLFAGGSPTAIAVTGTTINYVAQYSFITSTWSALSTGMNGFVLALAVAPNGNIYAGGQFTTAGGGGANRIAVWNGSAWAALGTGLNGDVNAIAVAPNGDVYVGGNFTTAGGGAATYIARWDGSAWAAVGTGMNTVVSALAFGLDGRLYAGGIFTTAGGGAANRIAVWNGTAWSALGAGMDASVNALSIAPNGTLYAGGAFTTAGGITANYVASWNGVQWTTLGTGISGGAVFSLAVNPRDNILYAGGQFTAVAGLASNYFARWNGSAWVRSDILLGGSNAVYAILVRPDGTVFQAREGNSPTSAAAVTTVTVGGTALGKPVVTITGPTAATALVVQLLNTTSGTSIFLSTTMSVGETITIDLRRASITSTFRGNILTDVLAGSDLAEWILQPGANTISFYSQASTVTATMYWANDLASLEDGWTK